MNDTTVPGWLSRLTWLGLTVTLAGIITLSLILSSGAADPVQAGPLLWQTKLPTPWLLTVATNQTSSLDYATVPQPPFTLEITARFSLDSDPSAIWRVTLMPVQVGLDMRPSSEIIAVDGSGDYAHGLDPRRIPFPHLAHSGEFNRLTLNVDKDNQETIRFNNEIAWHGVFLPGMQVTQLSLSASGGWQLESRLTWAQISVYAPLLPTITHRAQLVWR